MIAQRIRISCPGCSRNLYVRADDLGRKGECKYCGHRFRVGAPTSSVPDPAARLGQWLQTLERELEQNRASLTAGHAFAVEQLVTVLGNQLVQSQVEFQSRVQELLG